MNELNKLLLSLLLLAAGYFAASFVGPPEAIDKLAHYLRPSPTADTQGLRPLPAVASTPAETHAWPALPAPPEDAAPETLEPRPAAPRSVAATHASWPTAPSPEAAEPAAWPDLPSKTPAPPTEDWLTAAALGAGAPAPPPAKRELTPIPRGGAAVAAQRVAQDSVEPAWPRLDPPQVAPTPATTTTLKPSLEDSPYGTRPRHDSAPLSEWNPLRLQPAGPRLDAIERQAAKPEVADHIVTDGDTLPRLAERYLGDPGRAAELFELNADRLPHPDILPIGMVLRIPKTPARAERTVSSTPAGSQPRTDIATLTAAGPTITANRPERRAVTRVERGEEPVRPAVDPGEALYDHDIMWDPARW